MNFKKYIWASSYRALFQNPVMPVIIFDANFTDLCIYCLNSTLISVDSILKITGKWNSASLQVIFYFIVVIFTLGFFFLIILTMAELSSVSIIILDAFSPIFIVLLTNLASPFATKSNIPFMSSWFAF